MKAGECLADKEPAKAVLSRRAGGIDEYGTHPPGRVPLTLQLSRCESVRLVDYYQCIETLVFLEHGLGYKADTFKKALYYKGLYRVIPE